MKKEKNNFSFTLSSHKKNRMASNLEFVKYLYKKSDPAKPLSW